jgi:hypothetical protein
MGVFRVAEMKAEETAMVVSSKCRSFRSIPNEIEVSRSTVRAVKSAVASTRLIQHAEQAKRSITPRALLRPDGYVSSAMDIAGGRPDEHLTALMILTRNGQGDTRGETRDEDDEQEEFHARNGTTD